MTLFGDNSMYVIARSIPQGCDVAIWFFDSALQRVYLMTFRALRSIVSATKIRNMTPLISCWVCGS